MKKWILPLLALCVVAVICFTLRKPQPSSLMTDLVSDASALYAGGYRVDARMQDLSDEELTAYQYAEIRSSRPTLGWIVPDMGEGTLQTAYRIVVDDNAADAANIQITATGQDLILFNNADRIEIIRRLFSKQRRRFGARCVRSPRQRTSCQCA